MFVKKLTPALLWAVLIMVLCGIPGNKIPELTFWQWLKPDKIIHLLIFGIQSWLLLRAFQTENAPAHFRNHTVAWALVLTIGYGALTEILQTAVFTRRYGDVRDALANALGAFAGWYFYQWKTKRLKD